MITIKPSWAYMVRSQWCHLISFPTNNSSAPSTFPPPLPSYLPRNIFRGITDDGHRLELTSVVAAIVIE